MKQIGRLHVLTDFRLQQRWSHRQLAEAAIAGGADTIQFREKKSATRHALRQAEECLLVCQQQGVPMIVDDRVDVAASIEADGVHVGQSDLPISHTRRVVGDAIIGATVSSVAEAIEAEAAGADYLGFGPVYSTRSKENPVSVKGPTGLQRVCEAVSIPVIAIAGINASRIPEIMRAGAFGFAVMSAVILAEDPEEATRQLVNELRRHIS